MPGYVSSAEVGAALRGALDGYLRAVARTDEADRALAAALGGIFNLHGPGGAKVTTKEGTKLTKAVKNARKRSKASSAAGKQAVQELSGLHEAPVPAAGPKAYALCGTA